MISCGTVFRILILYSAHLHCTCFFTTSLDFFHTLAQHCWMLSSCPVSDIVHLTQHWLRQGTAAHLEWLCCPAQPCKAQWGCSGAIRSISILCLWLASVKTVGVVQWLTSTATTVSTESLGTCTHLWLWACVNLQLWNGVQVENLYNALQRSMLAYYVQVGKGWFMRLLRKNMNMYFCDVSSLTYVKGQTLLRVSKIIPGI